MRARWNETRPVSVIVFFFGTFIGVGLILILADALRLQGVWYTVFVMVTAGFLGASARLALGRVQTY